MPYNISQIINACNSLDQFRTGAISKHHERYIFPFLCGTHFVYRKVDVLRVVAIAKSISASPSFADIGCGYGDFLDKVRNYIPDAVGYEKDALIFYARLMPVPNHIRILDVKFLKERFDVCFVGWMEPGVDFRDAISRSADVVITTLDQGLSLAAEFEGHGYTKLVQWRTPSWDDINIEIMNKFYTKLEGTTLQFLSLLRGAHNLWYVYAKPHLQDRVKESLQIHLEKENAHPPQGYDFEEILDSCGFRINQHLDSKLQNAYQAAGLWEVQFLT